MYDLIIIGGGPAGTAAGIYASRKQLKTLLITKEWGGQSNVSPEIQNWIGTPKLSGAELAEDLKTHLETYAGEIVTIKSGQVATKLERVEEADAAHFAVTTDDGESATARAVLITSGSTRRRLDVPGADAFEHKGLTYCATCDGPLFAGQDVAVIGGGNAGFETAAQLLAYAKSVTLLHRGQQYKADPVTVEKVLGHEQMTGIPHSEPTEVFGEQMVTGLRYVSHATGEEQQLAVTGVFVEIGMIPNTAFVADVVERDEYDRIVIDPWTQQTSTPGVWAAGDCTNIKYHQNNISAGDAVRALEDIYVCLKTR
jgi:alkyl hydroperoxide reductase subunit F